MFDTEFHLLRNVTKNLWKIRRWFYRCGCLILIIFIGFFGFLIFGAIQNIVFYKMYDNYLHAMTDGNSKKAVYYAEKLFHQCEKNHNQQMKKYGHTKFSARYIEFYFNLCYAYELNGEYEKALICYENVNKWSSDIILYSNVTLSVARIYYRKNRKNESFDIYCSCFSEDANQYDNRKGYQQAETQEYLYNVVMCHTIIEDSRRFRPYPTFHDFYDFMKKEYEQRGSPKEYAKVMELLRRTDTEADKFMRDHKEYTTIFKGSPTE